ncbi:MAG: hypothetical protein P4L53_28185, partial [Candidatus Obscuribacterales bacterium]|nr:hypothetical protein [Candidatus Obscuribacterales bacterium]
MPQDRKPPTRRNSAPFTPKPRAARTSDDFQRSFKERRLEESTPRSYGSESAGAPQEGGYPRRPFSKDRNDKPRKPVQPDNVNLFLSPRMIELAEELAQESKMNLRTYMTEALKYVLLAHGKRLGKSDKYVNEFVSQNDKTINTWKPGQPQVAQTDDGEDTVDDPNRKSPKEQLGLSIVAQAAGLSVAEVDAEGHVVEVSNQDQSEQFSPETMKIEQSESDSEDSDDDSDVGDFETSAPRQAQPRVKPMSSRGISADRLSPDYVDPDAGRSTGGNGYGESGRSYGAGRSYGGGSSSGGAGRSYGGGSSSGGAGRSYGGGSSSG